MGLTTLVSELWETVYQEQGSGRRLQPGGSLLWSRNWGCVLPRPFLRRLIVADMFT